MKSLQWLLLAGTMFTATALGMDSSAPPIKTLPAEEQAALLAGQGMGFAKAAELNGYPGPRHVLDLAAELELTAGQRQQARELFERMLAAARAAGAELLEAERSLDELYASKTANVARVEAQLAKIERVRTRLRGVHLNAHLEQAALLTPAQVARYARLRGHGVGGHGAH
jgi:Spy/CpxP family protein refolding chaperone